MFELILRLHNAMVKDLLENFSKNDVAKFGCDTNGHSSFCYIVGTPFTCPVGLMMLLSLFTPNYLFGSADRNNSLYFTTNLLINFSMMLGNLWKCILA